MVISSSVMETSSSYTRGQKMKQNSTWDSNATAMSFCCAIFGPSSATNWIATAPGSTSSVHCIVFCKWRRVPLQLAYCIESASHVEVHYSVPGRRFLKRYLFLFWITKGRGRTTTGQSWNWPREDVIQWYLLCRLYDYGPFRYGPNTSNSSLMATKATVSKVAIVIL